MTVTQNLVEINDTMWRVTNDIDLVYSQDDEEKGGKGWYLQKFPGGKCSDLYRSDYEAVKALKDKKVVFK